jgi:hypothetical protein
MTIDDVAATEFTDAWEDFERKLAEALAQLYNLTAGVSFTLFAGGGRDRDLSITFETRLFDGIGLDSRFPGIPTIHDALSTDPASAAEPARRACGVLRDEWSIPHPSLLTMDVGSESVREVLGLGSPSAVVDELDAQRQHRASARRVARRGGAAADALQDFLEADDEGFPSAIFPLSTQHLRELVEAALTESVLDYRVDDDGDFVVRMLPILGARIYVTVLEDRPLLRIWRPVVREVNSRRSAVIEANYLNRTYPLTKWTLSGQILTQELFVPATPFVAERFIESIRLFDEHHDETISALKLRLGADSE